MNGFVPMNTAYGLPNPYEQRYQQSQNSNPTTNMNFVVVENLQKAKEQIVPYGYTMWMRDSSQPYQYIKSVDSVGTPTFKVLKVEDVTDQMNQSNQTPISSNFVDIKDFNDLSIKVDNIQNTMSYLSSLIIPQPTMQKEDKKKVEKVGANA